MPATPLNTTVTPVKDNTAAEVASTFEKVADAPLTADTTRRFTTAEIPVPKPVTIKPKSSSSVFPKTDVTAAPLATPTKTVAFKAEPVPSGEPPATDDLKPVESFTTERSARASTLEFKGQKPTKEIVTQEIAKPTFQNLRALEDKIDALAEGAMAEGVSELAGQDKSPTGANSIRVETFGDDRFYEFFSETVAMDRNAMKAMAKGQKPKRDKKNYFNTSSINTSEVEAAPFVKSESVQIDLQQPEPQDVTDYDNLSDAPNILHDLNKMSIVALVRFILTALLSVGVAYFTGAIYFNLPLPEFYTGNLEQLLLFTVGVLYIAACIVIAPSLGRGFAGLFTAPSQDSFVAVGVLATITQLAVLIVTETPVLAQSIMVFAPIAALAMTANAFGKYIQMNGIADNFSLATEGYDHSAAYLVKNREAVMKLTHGITEEYPELMLSRPTALVKNFLRQSFSPHDSDKNGKRLSLAVLFTGIVAAVITFYLSDSNLAHSASTFAATITISAPLAAIFVLVVPSLLMNKSAARVGAIIPGWESIEGISRTTAVMLDAHDIFPPATVRLHGIKTFNKERIDLAILYASSILIPNCPTLRDIFLSIIEGKTDMLYEVEELNQDVGKGFTGWVDGKRITVGNRAMMDKHEILLPSEDLENKFSRAERSVIYLAVSGKIFGMFLISYKADPDIKSTIDIMINSGVSLVIKSDDFSISDKLVSEKFRIEPESLKVLNAKETEIAQRFTGYLPESEGIMTHFGSFSSFIGGMRAASAAEAAERGAATLQLVSTIISIILSVILSVTGGLFSMSLGVILLYQVVWLLLTLAVMIFKRY